MRSRPRKHGCSGAACAISNLEQPVRLQKLHGRRCSINVHETQEEAVPGDGGYRQNKRRKSALGQFARNKNFIVDGVGSRLQHKGGSIYAGPRCRNRFLGVETYAENLKTGSHVTRQT